MKRSGFKRKPKVKKVKKPKAKTTSQLKKQLDAIFSRYVRQKHADQNGRVRCYTCGVIKDINEIQNGHFVSRSILSLRFDERNCRPQCVGCNIFGHGKVSTFGHKLEQEERGIVAELYKQAQQIVKDFPYKEKIEYYQKEIEKLNEQNSK